MECRLCNDSSEIESEEHLLKCTKIQESIEENSDIQNVKYENIFSDNIDEQLIVTKVFDKVFKLRRKLLNM